MDNHTKKIKVLSKNDKHSKNAQKRSVKFGYFADCFLLFLRLYWAQPDRGRAIGSKPTLNFEK